MSQNITHEVFKISRGFLIRFFSKTSNNQVHIHLEQFKYNSKGKLFELAFKDVLSLQPLTNRVENARINFIENSDENRSIALLVTIELGAEKSSQHVVVSRYEESARPQLKFTNKLSASINEYIQSSLVGLISHRDLYIKFGSDLDRYFLFHIGLSRNTHKPELVIYSNDSNYRCNIPLVNLNADEIEKFRVLKFLEFDPSDDDLSTKIIVFLKYEAKSRVKIVSNLIDIESKRAFSVNCRQVFGDHCVNFNKSDSRLVQIDTNPMRLNRLDEVFFEQLDRPQLDASLEIDIGHLNLVNYELGMRNGALVLSGDCHLILQVNNEYSVLVSIKVGSIIDRVKLDAGVFEAVGFILDKSDQLYLAAKKPNSSLFNLYHVNQKCRLICENLEAQVISHGLFMTELDLIVNYYVYIFNWKTDNYEMREHLLESRMNHEPSFSLDFDQQIDEIFETSIQKMPETAIKQPITGDMKQTCMENLAKALERKQREADLILDEACVEIRRKLSLISELSSFYSLRSGDDQSMKQILPRLIEFYNSEIKNSTKTTLQGVQGNLPSFRIELTWTCYLNESFSFNFLVFNDSCKYLNELNCIALISSSDTADNKYIEVEYSQHVLPVKPKLYEDLIKNDSSLISLEFEKMVDDNLIEESNHVEPNEYLLITLKLTQDQYKRMLSYSPNGSFKLNLHINSMVSSELNQSPRIELFKVDFPLVYDVFENLVQIDKPNLKLHLTLLNMYRSCSMSGAMLKCINASVDAMTRHLKDKLGFECVFKSDRFTILHQSRQCLITDMILVLKTDLSSNGLSLKVFSNTTQQVNAFICMLNKSIKSKESKWRVEIDLTLFSQLQECVKNEMNLILNRSEEVNGNSMDIDTDTDKSSDWYKLLNLERKADNCVLSIIR